MSLTVDLGRRIELVSMDPHFCDITIGLYPQQGAAGPEFLVHSYSRKEGVPARIAFVRVAMEVLGGLERVGGQAERLHFPCKVGHSLACRRVFLEACKLGPASNLEPRFLHILDKKTNRTITALSIGKGIYQITADGEETDKTSRIAAVAGGLMKLGQMEAVELDAGRVAFSCGQAHDALVGLLLVRALNVRAILREQEMAASRGILSAPSAQK